MFYNWRRRSSSKSSCRSRTHQVESSSCETRSTNSTKLLDHSWIRPSVNWELVAFKKYPQMSWDLSSVKKLQSLTLHQNDVNGVAFSSNLQLATASSDKTSVICQWEQGQGFVSSFTLRDHKYSVTCVEWSPYGSILATGSVDGTVGLYDVTSGEKLTSFVQPGNAAVRTCNFSNQSNFLLSAGDSGTVNVWDLNLLAAKKLTISFQHGEEAVYAACELSSYLVSGCGGGHLSLWEMGGTHSKPLASFENGHENGVTSVSFAPALVTSDGGLVKLCLMITGGQDHLVKLWNVTTGLDFDIEPLRTLSAHSASVFCVRIGVNGLIASASADKTLRLWNLGGTCLKVLEGHDRYVTSCSFSKDGKLLASGSNKNVYIWDLSGECSLNDDLSCYDYTVSAEEMWPHYEKMCKLKMKQERSVNLISSFEVQSINFNSCLLLSTHNILLAVSNSSKCLYGWDLESNEELKFGSECAHKDSITSIDYCPKEDILVSASGDGSIMLSTINNKVMKQSGSFYHPSGGAIRVCRFSPDGSLLLAGSDNEDASLWNVKSGTLIKMFTEHNGGVFGCSFSPCGQYVVTGCSNGWIKLWDTISPTNTNSICTQKGAHELGVTTCHFSSTGLGGTRGQHRLLLATGGNDSLVKLWQVSIRGESGEFLLWQTFSDHGTANNIYSVSFIPSGKLLASASQNIRFWDPSTGSCVKVIEGHSRYVTCVSFSVDGTQLASCSGDHSVKIWSLDSDLNASPSVSKGENVEIITKWTVDEVIGWVAEIGYGHLGHVFETHSITGQTLLELDDEKIQNTLDIQDDKIRKQLVIELQWLRSLGMSSKKCISNSNTITVPQEFFCPITHDIFSEPVLCADGNTYELGAIKAWFLMGRTTSPLTNMELSSLHLTPNFELQNKISEFLVNRLNNSSA